MQVVGRFLHISLEIEMLRKKIIVLADMLEVSIWFWICTYEKVGLTFSEYPIDPQFFFYM